MTKTENHCWSLRRAAAIAAVAAGGLMLVSLPAAAQKDIVIGAKEPGSSFYTYAAAIAGVLTKATGKTGKVLSVAGAGVWLPMMENKEADVGLVSHYQGWVASVGRKPFPRKYDVRLVLVGGGINVGLYVRNDSPIKSRKDIKGKRVGCKYAGSPVIHTYAEAEIANPGFAWGDLKCVPRTSLYAGQRDDVKEKRLEVFYASVGSGVTRELDSTIGIRFLGVDPAPEAVTRMKKVYPVVVTKVKAGPPGIREDMWLVRLPVYLITQKNVSADVIYEVTKALWDRNDALKKAHKRTRSWDRGNFADPQAILPYHPGAIRLYKEKGVWTKQMEDAQAGLTKGM